MSSVDPSGNAGAATADQIRPEHAKRFGTPFTDEDGNNRHPLILHLSPSGAVERVIYALLEKAAAAAKAGRPPMLPVWLSPTQVRLVPVAAADVEYARTLVPRLEGIRVGLDDSGDSVGRKLRHAENGW